MSQTETKTKVLRAFKGFDQDFKCRGYQFSVGGEYAHSGAVVPCDSGFHACIKAVDVWNYYEPAMSRYAEVELSGAVVAHDSDSKYAASNVKILREILHKDFLAQVIAEIFSEADYAKNASSGNSAKNASSGNSATNAATGENSVIAAAGANSLAKGAMGTWISLAEYAGKKCVGFAVGCIGQNGLEPDTWYKAQNGKLVPEETK